MKEVEYGKEKESDLEVCLVESLGESFRRHVTVGHTIPSLLKSYLREIDGVECSY